MVPPGAPAETDGETEPGEGDDSPAADTRETAAGQREKARTLSSLHRMASAMAEVHPLNHSRLVQCRAS